MPAHREKKFGFRGLGHGSLPTAQGSFMSTVARPPSRGPQGWWPWLLQQSAVVGIVGIAPLSVVLSALLFFSPISTRLGVPKQGRAALALYFAW